jgi:hypothetical protein
MKNVVTVQANRLKKDLSGNPTYRDLAASSEDNFRIADNSL